MELIDTNKNEDLKDNAYVDTEIPPEMTQFDEKDNNETSIDDPDYETKQIIKSQNRFKKIEKRPSKKVTFAYPPSDSSDSESDIGTDVDFDEFRRTLNL